MVLIDRILLAAIGMLAAMDLAVAAEAPPALPRGRTGAFRFRRGTGPRHYPGHILLRFPPARRPSLVYGRGSDFPRRV